MTVNLGIVIVNYVCVKIIVTVNHGIVTVNLGIVTVNLGIVTANLGIVIVKANTQLLEMLLLMNDANLLQMMFYSIYKHCAIVLAIIDSIYKHCGNLSTSTCGIVLVIIDSIYKHCAIV